MTKTGLSKEAERHHPLTDSDLLREALNKLENQLGVLGRTEADEAIEIPSLLDEAAFLIDSLRAKGSPLQAEEVRMRTILAKLERNAPKYLSTVGADRLAKARPEDVPDNHWWWYADRKVAEQRRAAFSRSLRLAAVVVGVVVVLAILYQAFLAPDPMVTERMRRMNNAELLVDEGDIPAALEQVHLAQTAIPDYPYTIIVEAVYHEALGDSDRADQLFSTAKALSENDDEFLIQRAEAYLRAYNPEAAIEDAHVLIERDPDSATGYYIRGLAEQALNQLDAAYNSFQRAAELADEANDTRLSGVARVQMAYLAQQSMTIPATQLTPTPQP